jgi:hypothetical protein
VITPSPFREIHHNGAAGNGLGYNGDPGVPFSPS